MRKEFEEPEIEQIYKVICSLPAINVQIAIRGPYGNEPSTDRPVVQPQTRETWMEIYADQEYVLNVQMIRLGSYESLHIHCPKFPKGKDEGWFLTLGQQAEAELIAMKRCVYRSNKSSHQLSFVAPKRLGILLSYVRYFELIIENQQFFFIRSLYLHRVPHVGWLHRTGPAVRHSLGGG